MMWRRGSILVVPSKNEAATADAAGFTRGLRSQIGYFRAPPPFDHLTPFLGRDRKDKHI